MPLAAQGLSTRSGTGCVTERFLPEPELLVHAPVGTQTFALPVGIQPERPALGEIVARDRHVTRVGLDRRTRAPQQIAIDTPLVGDEIDSEVGSQRPQL